MSLPTDDPTSQFVDPSLRENLEWTTGSQEFEQCQVTCAPSDVEYGLLSGNFDLNNLASEPDFTQHTSTCDAPFTDFASWIPGYVKRDTPCEYCRSKHLVCFTIVSQDENVSCNACTSLFRSCSFCTNPTQRTKNVGRIDTLQPLPEDIAQESGALTGTRPMNSNGATSEDIVQDMAQRHPVQNYKRFSRINVYILKSWLKEHADNPYPTEEQKEGLCQKTGLTVSQVSNWLANARRRGKARSKPFDVHSELPNAAQPLAIPERPNNLEHLTPFERWKISPPENDPAQINDIARAIQTTDLDDSTASSGPTSRSHSISDFHHRNSNSTTGSALSTYQEPSISSFETGHSSGSYGASSAFSHASSRGSYGVFARKDQRRRKRTSRKLTLNSNNGSLTSQRRAYQCTFCTDTFASKYDWNRHEKSLHLSLERWVCAPLGPVVTLPDGNSQCVFCELLNPSSEHLMSHNHVECEEKDLAARTFYRKDHLRQHLRLVHDMPKILDSMESWRAAPSMVRSRCGFCSAQFTTWAARSEHLAKHFREGAKMCDWKGGWGFDPEVEASVANAMPPFMISIEAKTPQPFSATDAASQAMEVVSADEGSQPRNVNCFEAFTIRLVRYAKELQSRGEVVTDAMLQACGRQLVYGDAGDAWNQTPADTPEWLQLFRQAHGLDIATSSDEQMNQEAAAFSLREMNGWLLCNKPIDVMAQSNNLDLLSLGQPAAEHVAPPSLLAGDSPWQTDPPSLSSYQNNGMTMEGLGDLMNIPSKHDNILEWDFTNIDDTSGNVQDVTEDLGSFNDLLFADQM